ncbi:hypothetical protein BJX61DRAFT_12277 [Aspergillus egyptiacus]|nr:hypothetical protein BJX61DRAFT_12277 [Aspergillus egyptiacus]
MPDVIVITGTGGMGLAIARRLGSGTHLILADCSPTQLENAAKILREEGHSVDTIEADVASLESVQNLAQYAASRGRIQLIAHTAGLSPAQASPSQIYQVDLLGTANVIDAFLPVASRGTCLIAIASLAGHLAEKQGTISAELEEHLALAPAEKLLDHPDLSTTTEEKNQDHLAGFHAYGISKRANILRVQASARAWGEKGARINSISPGLIATPMGHDELASASGEYIKGMIAASPAGRIGTAADVANAVAFLAGAEASFITGTDLLLDGGWAAAGRWSSVAN